MEKSWSSTVPSNLFLKQVDIIVKELKKKQPKDDCCHLFSSLNYHSNFLFGEVHNFSRKVKWREFWIGACELAKGNARKEEFGIFVLGSGNSIWECRICIGKEWIL